MCKMFPSAPAKRQDHAMPTGKRATIWARYS